ncbi:LCP family protein [Succinispira mobilis]|uniref:LCP family protein n=1 Tax=Succinispira mobilis TaxID=78120 RepID=UPI00036FCF91|nr:LCP family protein [Succinispira mobilis]
MFKKVCMITAIVVAVVTAAAVFFSWFFKNGKEGKRLGLDDLLTGRTNIVVMGVDERDSDQGRSDTLMVVMLDPKTEQVTVLSIPRDTRVRIPGKGWDKINHAFAFGGHKLTQETVEDFLGVRIHHYVVIDFKGFKSIVDAVDGIDIDVEKRMYYEDPYDNLVIDLQPGMQHLTGEQAIHYVRYRDEEGDIGRVKRQQKFIKALYDKVTSPSNIKNMPQLLKVVSGMVKTDMYTSNIASIAGTMKKALAQGLNTQSIPGEPEYIDGISYWIPDIEKVRAEIAQIQGGKITEKYKTNTQELKAEYKKSLQTDNVDVDKEENKGTAVPIDKKSEKATTDKKDAKDAKDSKTNVAPSKDGATTSKAVPAEVNRPLNVILIKCTEKPGAIDNMKKILAENNVNVLLVKEGELRDSTRVVSATTNRIVVDRLSNLPFNYSLRVANNENVSADAIIFVGSNY